MRAVVLLLALYASWNIQVLVAGDSAFTAACAAAQESASRPYVAPDLTLPASLAGLDYDAYRKIIFRPERALWLRQDQWRVDWFHRGSLHRDRVQIMRSASAGAWQATPFDRRDFEYLPELTKLDLPSGLTADLGQAGFKLLHPLNAPDHFDEVAAFLDASYFRLLGRNHIYGASCRALGLRTGRTYEEFPRFTRWWFAPVEADNVVRVAGVLESQSVTGAYGFAIKPGLPTVVDVEVQIFARNVEREVILAPITSMFLWDGSTGIRHDVRPEVHDSDTMLIHGEDGMWTSRALVNRPGTFETVWNGPVKGFGLLQRDRDPEHYHDREALYHRRPGLWIEPQGTWPLGQVWLHEHNSPHEGYDNINAGYRLSEPLMPGKPLNLRYRISVVDDVRPPNVASVRDWTVVQSPSAVSARIVFAGDSSGPLPIAVVESSNGAIPQTSVSRIGTGWDVRLINPSNIPATCWSVRLIDDRHVMSEQWQFPWRP